MAITLSSILLGWLLWLHVAPFWLWTYWCEMGFGLVAAVDGCAPWAVRCLWVYWETASEKVPNGEDMDVWRMVM